ncbi:unnamed protein product [Mycena citricolor]|uniref:DUF6593 domain-containing protein n=1 Tax=Mycena citricolor TaxID=2018698 RepID=A0AAD2HH35_9AGAR|nr:unnamed protein product [Mycena citricolor]
MDTVLHFVYSKEDEIRTFKAFQRLQEGDEAVELYEFYHASYGYGSAVTTFQRRNRATSVFEPAGEIAWQGNTTATVHFGVHEACKIAHLLGILVTTAGTCADLPEGPEKNEKVDQPVKQSRRFKAGGVEYKWKIAEGDDLYCVEASSKKTVATWTDKETTLRVTASAEQVLDRMVVTCVLNLWVRHLGLW